MSSKQGSRTADGKTKQAAVKEAFAKLGPTAEVKNVIDYCRTKGLEVKPYMVYTERAAAKRAAGIPVPKTPDRSKTAAKREPAEPDTTPPRPNGRRKGVRDGRFAENRRPDRRTKVSLTVDALRARPDGTENQIIKDVYDKYGETIYHATVTAARQKMAKADAAAPLGGERPPERPVIPATEFEDLRKVKSLADDVGLDRLVYLAGTLKELQSSKR